MSSLLDELKNSSCRSVISTGIRPITCVPADSDVLSIYKILADNQISSAPVVDYDSGAICGMVDYVDLADLFIDGNNIKLNGTARMLADRSMKDPFYSTGIDSPVSTVLEIFGSGIHRIVLMNDDINFNNTVCKPADRICGIISQSDILRWIIKNWKNGDDDSLNRPLSSVVPITYPAIAIATDDLLIDAIRKMRVNSVSSIAVVENGSQLIGSLSVSDLKYFITSPLSKDFLNQSVLTFISVLLSEIGISQGKDRYPFYDVYENTPILKVIEKLLATKSHRVWVVERTQLNHNHHSQPHSLQNHFRTLKGVVSMTDIIRGLFKTRIE